MSVAVLRDHAADLGFSQLGVAHAGRSQHADRYLEWISQGRHGTMGYLARQVERRIDPRETVPGASSVIVVTLPYDPSPPFPGPDDTGSGKIARYARGRDYHKVMVPRLRSLADHIAADGRWQTWYSVDTGPILERDWAAAAGIGWIGKNALILDREHGSYFFLGVIVTDRPYDADAPATDHCGSCTACIDACPTDALATPHSVDARRCISYLTIEHKGAIASELSDQLHGWVFGCDICQEVCPFNQRALRRQVESDTAPSIPSDFTPRDLPTSLDVLRGIDREEFLESFAGTPVMRAGHESMRRNAELNADPSPD